MKCPICGKDLVLDKDSGDYGCWNGACSMAYLSNVRIPFWKALERNLSRFKIATPRWRPFDLDEIRRSLPVIVTSKDGSMDYTLLIRCDAEIDIKFRMGFGGWHKEDLVWLPVPKVEVK